MFYNPVLVCGNIENSLKSCLEKDQFSVYLLGFFPHKLNWKLRKRHYGNRFKILKKSLKFYFLTNYCIIVHLSRLYIMSYKYSLILARR